MKQTQLKKFKVRKCPKCESDNVIIAIGGQVGMWECKDCGFRGPLFPVIEMDEDEYMKYLDEKGEEGMPEEIGEPETVSEKKSHKEMLKEKMDKGEEI